MRKVCHDFQTNIHFKNIGLNIIHVGGVQIRFSNMTKSMNQAYQHGVRFL